MRLNTWLSSNEVVLVWCEDDNMCDANRCRAKSKRTGQQCKSPAVPGKRVCRIHGGLSTGPKTPEGRARCAAAKTIHGGETRAIREARRVKLAELRAFAAEHGVPYRGMQR